MIEQTPNTKKARSSNDSSTRQHDWLPLATMAVAVGLALSFLLVFFWAPPVIGLGLDFKIFFFHVPAAWMMLLSAVTAGVAALRALLGHRPDWTAMAALDLAFLFGLVVIITGPLWAWRAWGTPWVWEPRLTTSLLCWLTFAVAILLRSTAGADGRKTALLLAILAAAEVPLVYLSVRWWSGAHHPPTSLVPHLHGRIAVTLLAATLSSTALWGLLLILTRRLLQAKDRATNREARLFASHGTDGALPLAILLVASLALPTEAAAQTAPRTSPAPGMTATMAAPASRPSASDDQMRPQRPSTTPRPRVVRSTPPRPPAARPSPSGRVRKTNQGFVPYRVQAKKHTGSLAAVLAAYLTFWLLILLYLVQLHLRMKKLEDHIKAIGKGATSPAAAKEPKSNSGETPGDAA
ncbi:MAG: cytochrome c biogenesis protein CcsA [Deltaproteobacteria bacterium]|nr:cytochrome c biogenesis protein CcsA [Deltaproteobacteria bacterium]